MVEVVFLIWTWYWTYSYKKPSSTKIACLFLNLSWVQWAWQQARNEVAIAIPFFFSHAEI